MIVDIWARVLAYVTVHWRAVLVAALVALLGVQTLRLSHAKADVKHAQAAVRVAQSALSQCQTNRKALEGAIDRQNRAVDALKADGDRRVAEAARGLSAAIQGRAAAEAKAKGILALKPTGNACADLQAVDAKLMETLR